jgi:hypothetical protein
MLAEVAAPNQVAAEIAVSKADDVGGFIGEECERYDETLVALTTSDSAFDQALAEEFEDAVIRHSRELHPRVDAQQGAVRILGELSSAQIMLVKNRRRFW